MDRNVAIKVEHLTKTYKIFDKNIDRIKETFNFFGKKYSKDFFALEDISFEVKKGENIGFVGKNGAGKSTLLKLITGVLTPTSGTIQVKGNIASLLELGAGFNPEMTGIENIYLNGSIMGYSKKEINHKIDDIIEFADIGEFIYQPVKMYSSGMFARLAFAVNAFIEPDILIVDEALSVGDNAFQIKCMKKMKDLMTGGTSILFVSHDINAIRRFCNRTFWIDHGRIRASGDTNWVVDQYSDFLKIKSNEIKRKPITENRVDIAEIIEITVLSVNGEKVDIVEYNEPLYVCIKYEVFNCNIQNPVIGVALKSINGDYICGLNTLLDTTRIPWQLGINHFKLFYPMGIQVTGGKYYFDVAIAEETATIPIQYIEQAKLLYVKNEYKGEGIFIIPHQWI